MSAPSVTADEPATGRKPSWFSKLTKKQAPLTSTTIIPQMSTSMAADTSCHTIEAEAQFSANSDSPCSTGKNETMVDACRCCGTLITYPSGAKKIKCSVCHTVLTLIHQSASVHPKKDATKMSYKVEKSLIYKAMRESESLEKGLKFLEEHYSQSFGNFCILNSSFRTHNSKALSTITSGINHEEVRKFYQLLLNLPTTRPYFAVISAANSLLSRPEKFNNPGDIYWLLILLDLPTLSSCLIAPSRTFSREINAVSYEVLKRIVGILGYSDRKVKRYLCRWFAKLPERDFADKVNLINLYITFHLNRCINNELKKTSTAGKLMGSTSPHIGNDDDRIDYKDEKRNSSSSGFWNLSTSSGTNAQHMKVKISQYGNDWHLRTAGRVLSIMHSSNVYFRSERIPSSAFYNTMVDYVHVKQDFDAWQYNCELENRRPSEPTNDGDPSLEYVVQYIQSISTTSMFGIGSPMSPLSTKMRPTFTFCQYPFLLSLGSKISILEYEAKKQMERKAEEAFISSVHKRIAVDVYFRLRVRRDHLSQDSLNAILKHSSELKKSLRVEFVNEPGIDAGGLKKEWFMLLSRELFSPANGLFTYSSESNLGWFSNSSIDNHEMYYLVGVVLGLAIYNSTILDLQFPQIWYKKLLGQRNVTLEDYSEIFPVAGSNLKKLLHYDKHFDFESLELYFDATYKDIFGELHTVELVPHGSSVKVTHQNKFEYVQAYINYFLNDQIAGQFKSFKNGFDNVAGGNALSLFDSEEIELILVGDDSGADDKLIDISILRVITKYQGGLKEDSNLVQWFWEYTESLTKKKQKQLLQFVSGSDRLPATGVQALNFKMTLLRGSANRLPIAHTCFNEICVFDYPSKEHFFEKLTIAINESEGFGIK